MSRSSKYRLKRFLVMQKLISENRSPQPREETARWANNLMRIVTGGIVPSSST